MRLKSGKEFQRERQPRVCDIISIQCPCKIVNFEADISICDFVPMYSDMGKARDSLAMEVLLSKVCPEIRNELMHDRFIVRQNEELARKFLDNVKVGDVVYCTADIENVIFLEFPSHEFDQCKYKAPDGFEGKAPAFAFRIISKGVEHARYESTESEKAIDCGMFAKRYGFRVEEHKVEDTYIIDIFGDKKADIEEYISNFESGLVLKQLRYYWYGSGY
ncbi:hypothetical protein LCGC14_1554490 [marine sediment metagenome]|uniref:Uncharacterized protein n=1 Tax=marine sediment metagenome TaxID=412755 RepID=A0A0F9L5H5_9ZZZZ|nr:hypothetical protein [bacterium]